MTQVKRWAGPVASVIALALSATMAVVSFGFAADARDSVEGAQALFDAQVRVADAQDKLEGTDLQEAITSAREANAVAFRVGKVTARIVSFVESAQEAVDALISTSQRGAQSAVFASRQLDAAAGILSEIGGYQRQAKASAGKTNRALRKVLEALRKTNRSFPGGG